MSIAVLGTGHDEPVATSLDTRPDSAGSPAHPALLRISDLNVSLGRRRHRTRILANVDLTVRPGEILGVIGETGSGKTTLARTVLGLVPAESGQVAFDGVDLMGLRGRARRDFRRSGRLQFTFQDPLRALDPQLKVGASVAEGLAIAGQLSRAERTQRVGEALRQVGLDPALAGRLPGQISGGQRQRVLLARALATRPELLICDEPVSALDASNRNYVLRLLDELRHNGGVSIMVISHDLSSLAGVADRVAVLYRGRIVEQGPVREVLTTPAHPYTALLTASAPSVRREHRVAVADLRPAPHAPAWTHPAGCVLAARCRFATDECAVPPTLAAWPADGSGEPDRLVACHHAESWPHLLTTPPSKEN